MKTIIIPYGNQIHNDELASLIQVRIGQKYRLLKRK